MISNRQRKVIKLQLIFLFLFCIAGSAFPNALYATPPGTSGIGIAVFDVDATPPIGSSLTYDPMINSGEQTLRARGIVLLGGGEPIVLCSVDWIGIANESQDIFKEALAEAAGTIPNRVVVHTVHQHDAPICDFTAEKILKDKNIPSGCFDGTFAREVIRRLQSAIHLSLNDVKEVTDIGIGSAEVYKVASNRRVYKKEGRIVAMRGSSTKDSILRSMPEGLIDPEVSLVSFWNNNTPLAVLSFYATHPQSYYLTKIANPDFPGIARFLRQLAVPDAMHIHFNGAGGNVAAGKYNDGSHENRLILARRMADGMERAWNNTKKYSVRQADLGWNTENLLLPYRDKVKEIETEMNQMNSRLLANNMGRLGWYKRRVEGKGIEIACLRIHNARILFMPGELFIEYQLAAKKMFPDNFVAMAAYGDYGPFYIGTEEAYAEGGYEIESSPVTAESEKLILAKIKRLLSRSVINSSYDLLTYRDRKGNVLPITNKNEWSGKREDILKNMQLVMGKLPQRQKKKLHVEYSDTAVYDTYIRYTINFEVAPSEKVFAYLYRPKNISKLLPAILALHGTGAEGKKIIDGAAGIKNRAYAKELAERGYVVIAPDYPSMGELGNYDFAKDRYNSGTMKGIYNHISCIDLLQSLPYVDKKRIGVIGHSLGGHNALFVAAFDPRIKVVVSSCGWTLFDYYHAGEKSIIQYGSRLGPWAQERYMPFIRDKFDLDAEKIPFDFDEIIAAIAPRPFFSNSPIYDLNFSVEGVRKCESRVREVYRFMNADDAVKFVYPRTGHDFPSEIREDAYRFIDNYLK
ncbi:MULTISPECIES: alpha/beta hydrolase [Proteiniphilum]|jgi:pimeloyl-ACP methyl ester carboxylesterase|uniref:alpha/beta hydrolase n=1 Tax=Proteiniphilum TaxID=294702 RepID=UPI001EEC9D27|nr:MULTISPECIES: alpha/beta fold hydrolase [Proteiniphilum]ULB35577.1 alpha/beta fold hydrolase [Proteiniphilum propionicum]